jgi:DNA polymerase-4
MFLCRSCLFTSHHIKSGTVCPQCRSRRVLSHDELDTLTIAHVDCDAFFAAIEKRDRPELANKPVIVGGGKRGVVSTCCYIARLYGVHSAMPMFKALQLCPDAVVISSSFERYKQAGLAIRAMMERMTPSVEPLSIDEAFLDLSGTERTHKQSAAKSMAQLARDIKKEIGITVSVGLSHNKFLAKLASDLHKPEGFCVIGKQETETFLAPLPVSKIWGVGKVSNARLVEDGYLTLGDLQIADIKALKQRYGAWGLHIKNLAFGKDFRKITTARARKSLSKETTFHNDIADFDLLKSHLNRLCTMVSARLKEQNLAGQTLTLKLKPKIFALAHVHSPLINPLKWRFRFLRTPCPCWKKNVTGLSFGSSASALAICAMTRKLICLT